MGGRPTHAGDELKPAPPVGPEPTVALRPDPPRPVICTRPAAGPVWHVAAHRPILAVDDLLELGWVRQAAPQVEDGVPRGTCTGRTQDDEYDVDADDCQNGEYNGDYVMLKLMSVI